MRGTGRWPSLIRPVRSRGCWAIKKGDPNDPSKANRAGILRWILQAYSPIYHQPIYYQPYTRSKSEISTKRQNPTHLRMNHVLAHAKSKRQKAKTKQATNKSHHPSTQPVELQSHTPRVGLEIIKRLGKVVRISCNTFASCIGTLSAQAVADYTLMLFWAVGQADKHTSASGSGEQKHSEIRPCGEKQTRKRKQHCKKAKQSTSLANNSVGCCTLQAGHSRP